MNSEEQVEFENEQVKVIRVRIGKHEQHRRTRRDRVIIWLTDARHRRTESGGKTQEITRKAGDVAWRPASEHQIENLGDEHMEVILVELKR